MATKFNAAFWKWFGDSKVTNSNGNPLTVYHGSRNIIEEFDIGMCEFGCHFGTKAQAEFIMTRGDHLYECYLSIQNPIRLKDCGGWTWECLWKQLEGHGFDIPAMKPAEEARGYAVIRRQIAEHGYDGIVYLNRHEAISHDDIDKVMDLWMRGKTDKDWARESSDTEFRKVVKSARDSWIVLNPAQIKSIDNDGTWDSDNNDIRSNPDAGVESLIEKVSSLKWTPIAKEVWETIEVEGLDEEKDAFHPRLWEMARLPISKPDSEKLMQFDEETVEKFNRFDIALKNKFKMRYIDLIDYEAGKIILVRVAE